MTKDELTKLNAEARARGYGNLYVDPNGNVRASSKPLRADKEFEKRISARAAEIRGALGTPTHGALVNKAGGEVEQSLPVRWMNRALANRPTAAETFLGLASMIPGPEAAGAMKIVPPLLRAGLAAGEGYMQSGKEGAERGAIESPMFDITGGVLSKLAGLGGAGMEYFGRRATNRAISESDTSALNDFLSKLYNRPGMKPIQQQLEKAPWFRVFKRRVGTPDVPGPLAYEGQQYDQQMKDIAGQIKSRADEMAADLKQRVRGMMDAVRNGMPEGAPPESATPGLTAARKRKFVKLTPEQVQKIKAAIQQRNEQIAQVYRDAADFPNMLKEATRLRKKAFEGGLPGDGSVMKEGSAAYEAGNQYEDLTDKIRGTVRHYLGDQGVAAFDDAKQRYAQTAVLSDLANLPDLASPQKTGAWTYNPSVLHKALETDEASISRRMGPDAFQYFKKFSRWEPFTGGDVPSNIQPYVGATVHAAGVRPYLGVRPESGTEMVVRPSFQAGPEGAPPPVAPMTRAGQAITKAAPALGKGAKLGAALGASSIAPPPQNVHVTPQQEEEYNRILSTRY